MLGPRQDPLDTPDRRLEIRDLVEDLLAVVDVELKQDTEERNASAKQRRNDPV